MRKPKPPTPRSVSATLRNAGFKAAERVPPLGTFILSEGYRAEWHDAGSTVSVGFVTADTGIHARSLTAMTSTLTRKGWRVRTAEARAGLPARLLVTEG